MSISQLTIKQFFSAEEKKYRWDSQFSNQERIMFCHSYKKIVLMQLIKSSNTYHFPTLNNKKVFLF